MFLHWIRWIDEKDFFAFLVPRHEHENGVRLINTRQVIKIAVLTELILNVVGVCLLGRAEQDQYRVRSQTLHQPRASRFKIILKLLSLKGQTGYDKKE